MLSLNKRLWVWAQGIQLVLKRTAIEKFWWIAQVSTRPADRWLCMSQVVRTESPYPKEVVKKALGSLREMKRLQNWRKTLWQQLLKHLKSNQTMLSIICHTIIKPWSCQMIRTCLNRNSSSLNDSIQNQIAMKKSEKHPTQPMEKSSIWWSQISTMKVTLSNFL